MNKIIRIILGTLLIIAIITVSLTGVYWLFIGMKKAILYIFNLDNEIVIAVLTLSVTAILSVVTLILSKNYETYKEAKTQLRDKKIPVYEEYIKFIFKLIDPRNKERNIEADNKQIISFLHEWTQKLIIWGDDEVVKAFVEFRKNAEYTNNGSAASVLSERIMYAMRKDLGHKNKKLVTGDILRIFVNNVDKIIKESGLKK